MIAVSMGTANISEVDFALNKVPSAIGYTRPSELNPGSTTQVQFDLSNNAASFYISDAEEGTPASIVITSISNGTLYNGNTQVNVGDVIVNPDFSQLKVDPVDGDTIATFEYKAMDRACRLSDKAVFKAPFTTLNISGNLFLDMNRDNQVNGTTTQNSCDGTTALYVNLLDANGDVLSAIPLATDGSYAFHYSDGVRANTDYTILLSPVAGTTGNPAPLAQLPAGCMNLDGENIESLNPGTTDGTPDGKIAVSVQTSDVTDVNFAITPTVKIGDRVWIEDDFDGDATTGNVTPVTGTTVTAVCDTGTFTAVTDNNGNYAINVPVNSNCTVSLPTPPNTAPTAGSNDNDVTDTTSENNKSHDSNGTTVSVGTVDNLTVDFGFANSAHIGDYFWIDTDRDGIQDPNEDPVPGATIELFDANGNPVTDVHGNHSVVTDANGTYGFDVIPGQSYQVRFTIPDDLAGKGYLFANGGANGNQYTINVTPQGGQNILTLDAGISCSCSNAPIQANGGNALNILSSLMMVLLTLLSGLYFVRRETIH
jgi:hypothetical protein